MAFAAAASAEKEKKLPPPVPEQKISFADLGFRGRPTRYMLEGGRACATVDYLDADHVLLTYSVNTVLPRHDVMPVHSDREVLAEVVDLKAGKITQKANWVLHNDDAYLWPLGGGKFLLRSGNDLTLVGSDLKPESFIASDLPVRWVQTDPGANLFVVIVEHEKHTEQEHTLLRHDSLLHNAPEPAEDEEAVGFRIQPLREQVFKAQLPQVGEVSASDAFWLRPEPVASGKYEIQLRRWGKGADIDSRPQIVAKVVSECRPKIYILNAERLIVNTCESGAIRLFGVGLTTKKNGDYAGKALWNVLLRDTLKQTVEPAAGGSRAVIQAIDPERYEDDDQVATGDLRVQDTGSGKMLLRLPLKPMYGTRHIADVSPDGKRLAVLRDASLEIYDLPAEGVAEPDAPPIPEKQPVAVATKK